MLIFVKSIVCIIGHTQHKIFSSIIPASFMSSRVPESSAIDLVYIDAGSDSDPNNFSCASCMVSDIAEQENDEMHFLNWWTSYDVCRSHGGTHRSCESRQRGGLEDIFADTIVLICCTVAEDWKYIASLLAF